MKKANKILKDLHNIKGSMVFGAFEVQHNQRAGRNLEITNIDIVNLLKPYEINFKALYGVDFDDVVYDDVQGNYELIDLDVESGNSYNWSGQCVFNYNLIKVTEYTGIDKYYIAIKFHRFGDVRGNYTDYMVLGGEEYVMESFLEILMEGTRRYVSIDYKDKCYEISTDIFKESCLFDVYSDDYEYNFDEYDVLLDIDNLASKADIKKGLIKYLKENK